MSRTGKPKIVMYFGKMEPNNYSDGLLPLGLLKCASMLDLDKYEVKIIIASAKKDYLKELLEEAKDALCLAVTAITGYSIRNNVETIRKVKKINPDLPIIWGGWHASILPEQTAEHECVDMVIVGQGERTFKEIVEHLNEGKALDNVKGIVFKKNGKIVRTEFRPMEDLNNFPPTNFELVDMENCIENAGEKRKLHYITSQGCPFRCAFCADSLVNKRRWSGLNAERIVGELGGLVKKHNIDIVWIRDTNFFVDMDRAKKIMKGIIDKKMGIEVEGLNARADQIVKFDDEMWQLLKRANVTDLMVGAESGLQEQLELLAKDITVEQTIKATERAREHGIMLMYSVMVGLPPSDEKNREKVKEEQRRELEGMFDMLDRAFPEKDYRRMVLDIYLPYPGTPLYDLSIKKGLKVPQSLEEWSKWELAGYVNTPWVGKDLVDRVEFLTEVFFPFANKNYKQFHGKKFILIQDLLHKLELARWKHRYFDFPIEFWTINLFRGIRNAIAGVVG